MLECCGDDDGVAELAIGWFLYLKELCENWHLHAWGVSADTPQQDRTYL